MNLGSAELTTSHDGMGRFGIGGATIIIVVVPAWRFILREMNPPSCSELLPQRAFLAAAAPIGIGSPPVGTGSCAELVAAKARACVSVRSAA